MALYNSGFPATYQNPYLMQQFQPQQPQQNSGGLIWVQGEAAAKSYLIAPNTSIALWDSESSVIYIKSADSSGMPSMKVLDYTIRENVQNAPKNANNDTYATKADLSAVYDQIAALKAEIGGITKGAKQDAE